MATMRPTPRNEFLGLLSDAYKWMQSPERAQQMQGFAGLLGTIGVPQTIERMAYGEDLTNINRANVPLLKPETADAMMTVAPFAPKGMKMIRATEGMPVGLSIRSVKAPQETALALAQQRAALPVSEGGLGLPPNNTAEMRSTAMNAIDYLHGTERLDRLLAGKNFDSRKATSGPMPFGTNEPSMASSYAMNKADTSLGLLDEGNLADYFQVFPKSMGERGKSPINVENIWYRLPQEKKKEILDKASRIGYANPEEAGGGFVLHPTSEGLPYSKSHWEYVLNRESKGNPLTALRKTFAESGMLDAYAPSELADIYKLAGFPYEITQTNAPWTSAKGVFTGKAMISNPINTSDKATLQETVIPFLKDQFKNDRTKVKTGGVDQWDKNTRFTPKQWVNQLEEDLAKGENSFVWTSIPDKVTAQLEKLGFNGIIDTGGKMGGEAHQVVIPFKPEQIRSRFAAFDPFRKDVATATAMGVALPDLLAAELPEEEIKRNQSAGLLFP